MTNPLPVQTDATGRERTSNGRFVTQKVVSHDTFQQLL